MRRAWLLGLCVVLLTAWPGAAQIRLFGGGTSPASGGGVGIDGTPTANQLAYWTNSTTIGGTSSLSVQITTLDLSAATSAIPWRSGTTAPLTCGPGMAFFDTDTAPYLHICTATDTWTPLSGGVNTAANYTWTGTHTFAGTPAITLGGTFLPDGDNTRNLGSNTARFSSVYTAALRSETLNLSLLTTGNGNIVLGAAGAGAIVLGPGESTTSLPAKLLRGPIGIGTNVNASLLTLQTALGTGSGTVGALAIASGALGGTSGTTGQTAVTRHTFGSSKVLTNNTAIAIVNATLASGSVHASQYHYAVEVTDGTDYQIEEGAIACHVTNKAGAIANNTCVKTMNQQAATSGTLVVTFAISAANPAVISVNANSSLTPSTGYPRVTYEVANLTNQGIALQ